MVKSQIAFYGIQEANGFELLRLLRREFSLMSRPEALQHREACLKCENPTWYSAERSVTLHSFDFTKYRLWTSLFRRGTIVNGQIVVCSFDLTEYHL